VREAGQLLVDKERRESEIDRKKKDKEIESMRIDYQKVLESTMRKHEQEVATMKADADREHVSLLETTEKRESLLEIEIEALREKVSARSKSLKISEVRVEEADTRRLELEAILLGVRDEHKALEDSFDVLRLENEELEKSFERENGLRVASNAELETKIQELYERERKDKGHIKALNNEPSKSPHSISFMPEIDLNPLLE